MAAAIANVRRAAARILLILWKNSTTMASCRCWSASDGPGTNSHPFRISRYPSGGGRHPSPTTASPLRSASRSGARFVGPRRWEYRIAVRPSATSAARSSASPGTARTTSDPFCQIPLCKACHMAVHMRFRDPEGWERFKVKDGDNRSRHQRDGNVVKPWIEWLDTARSILGTTFSTVVIRFPRLNAVAVNMAHKALRPMPCPTGPAQLRYDASC
jgi:hypothetical protein